MPPARGSIHGRKVHFNITLTEPCADKVLEFMDKMKIPYINHTFEKLLYRGLLAPMRKHWFAKVFKEGMKFQEENPNATSEEIEEAWSDLEGAMNELI